MIACCPRVFQGEELPDEHKGEDWLMMTDAQSLFTGVVALALTVLTVGFSAAEPVRAAPPRLALAPALAPASAAPAPHQQASTVWLCRPGLRDNPCEANLTTTVVRSTGATNVQRAAPAKNPPIDCFYVYPTISTQPTINATLRIDPEEREIAADQVSRFSQDCRAYAPIYRQITLRGSRVPSNYAPRSPAVAIAYGSLLSSWNAYLAHDNHGRGVVLIGHSQGASVLIKLIRSHVDPNPSVRRRLVSAILLGGNVLVRVGKDVSGSFQHILACRAAQQTSGVVAYSAFNTQPTAVAYFGRVVPAHLEPWQTISPAQAAHLQVLCANPAALAGGAGALEPYFPTRAAGAPRLRSTPGHPHGQWPPRRALGRRRTDLESSRPGCSSQAAAAGCLRQRIDRRRSVRPAPGL
jgi:hypothetical protein